MSMLVMNGPVFVRILTKLLRSLQRWYQSLTKGQSQNSQENTLRGNYGNEMYLSHSSEWHL